MSRPTTVGPGPLCSCWECTLATRDAIDQNHANVISAIEPLRVALAQAAEEDPSLALYDRALGRLERIKQDIEALEYLDHRARMEDDFTRASKGARS